MMLLLNSNAKPQHVLWFVWGAFGAIVLVSAALLGFIGRILISKKNKVILIVLKFVIKK